MTIVAVAAAPSDPDLIPLAEFRRRFSISKSSFYRRAAEMPPVVKIGRRTLSSSEAAEEWRRRMEREAAVSGREAA
jgi:hypothetical protein